MMKEPTSGQSEFIYQQLCENQGFTADHKQYIDTIIADLNMGKYRACEKLDAQWHTHQWVKQAILCYLKMTPAESLGPTYPYHRDIVPPKFHKEDPHTNDIRNVPPTHIRYGAYVSPGVILMPCFVNIGAHIGKDSMIDCWASIGSCAQIGERCHISAGSGIGGVLEPLQATPTVIEDDCFIGARCEIAEGVHVEQGAVIACGTFITQSTKIYDRTTGETFYGRIPSNAVVVPGSLPSKDGTHHLNAAIIVKYADAQTRAKTSINQLLRE